MSEITDLLLSLAYTHMTTWDIVSYILDMAMDIFIIVIAFILLVCTLFGCTIYLLFFEKNEANKTRLLNVLYANLSVCFQIGGVFMFMQIFEIKAVVGEGRTIVSCLLLRSLQFCNVFTLLLFIQISVVTSISHFNPSLYLNLSLSWRRFPVILFQLLIVILIFAVNDYGSDYEDFCDAEETWRNLGWIVLPLILINLLLQLGVVLDTCWGRKSLTSSANRIQPQNAVNMYNCPTIVEKVKKNLLSKSFCQLNYLYNPSRTMSLSLQALLHSHSY